MNESFIERIFPHSADSVLPRYKEAASHSSTPNSPQRIYLHESVQSSGRRGSSPRSPQIEAVPLSASIVHHDDPFLPVERAAKALQRTIQSYLDAQAEGLNASLTGTGQDDLSSVGSPTPTPSVTTPVRDNKKPKTIPVRQPRLIKTSLRGARRGLVTAMEEFARLKEEELSIIGSESASRQSALKKSRQFQDKKASIIAQIEDIRAEESASNEARLRLEAEKVQREIHELESRLFELRTRNRQLITQADQFANSMDSKLSSYRSSLALIEKDMGHFLRHPPVASSLPLFDETNLSRGGMHSLKAERRTIEMAQEQWTAESELLSSRQADVESEREALQEGVKIWREATRRIGEFEKSLRSALRGPVSSSTEAGEVPSSDDRHTTLLKQLNDLIISVQADLSTAEANSWNLLICCLGAELEALQQGRIMLGGIPDTDPLDNVNGNGGNEQRADEDENAGKPASDLLNGAVLNSPGARSNQSLQDTLEAFGDGAYGKGKEPVRSAQNGDATTLPFSTPPRRPRTAESRDESEDDDPGPDFFVSH